MPRLPGTLVISPVSSFSTRRSARALIRWISAISSSTRPSTSSACRVQHSAASSVYRTGSPHSAKSDGYMRAARARHAATIRSDAPANTDSSIPGEYDQGPEAIGCLPVLICLRVTAERSSRSMSPWITGWICGVAGWPSTCAMMPWHVSV
jgi:hypothetical protein